MKRKPKPPTTTIKNCTFTGTPTKDSEAVVALARALESNAEAIRMLAEKLDRAAPMVQVG